LAFRKLWISVCSHFQHLSSLCSHCWQLYNGGCSVYQDGSSVLEQPTYSKKRGIAP
jgi:hypothetical protein